MEETQIYIVNVAGLCRTCLNESNDILELQSLDTLDCGMSKILSIFWGCEVDNQDGLFSLCSICVGRLRECFIFYQQCQKSSEIFRKLLQVKPDTETTQIIVENPASADQNVTVELEKKQSHLKQDQDHSDSQEFVCGSIDDDILDNEGEKNDDFEQSPQKGVRLQEIPLDEVNEALDEANRDYYENTKCIKCDFKGTNSRGLAIHMLHLHKETKNTWCPDCNLEFENLEEHSSSHSKESFDCKFCGRKFTTRGRLNTHFRAHAGSQTYKCHQCNKSFSASTHLKTHLKSHSKEKPYQCKLCPQSFNYLNLLTAHLKQHESEHVCPNCHGRFATKEQESSHNCEEYASSINEQKIEEFDDEDDELNKMGLHGKPQNFCQECNRKVRSLSEHIKNVHQKVATAKPSETSSNGSSRLCTVCGKKFSSGSKLRIHMRTHTGETPYKCSSCDKTFRTSTQLITHGRIHTGERPYSCDICGKTFTQSSVLSTHMRLHTGKTEACTICGQKFCRPGFLRLHMRKHTGEKPYRCDQCGQSFIQQSHLTGHLKTHTDERPHTCSYCEKSFKHLSTLKNHVEIHLGYKRYKCSQCVYACRQSYSLTQHMKQHATDAPRPDKSLICSICTKGFNTFAMLSSHALSIHNIDMLESKSESITVEFH